MGQNRVTVQTTPPIRQAVSGHYAGWVLDNLWTFGGCDFPTVPCADGGEKRYYPIAYGAGVQVPDGVVVIGGTNGTHSHRFCFFVESDGTPHHNLSP